MIIYFYDMVEDVLTMPKTPINQTTVTGSVRGIADILNPTIEFESGVETKNYAYIPDFNRYYFCDNPRIIRTGIVEVSMHVDVLQTYADGIKNAPIIAERSENLYNYYIADSERKFYQYTENQYVTVGDLGIPDTPILVTVG